MKEAKQVDFTIIIPVYYNAGELFHTFSEIKEKVLDQQGGKSYEVIFIDDGSKDTSLQELMQIRSENKEIVKVIKLSRNFGQLSAMIAGYRHARGKCIINISADLQDPPELMNEMLDYHFNKGYEIVVCTREGREESWFRRITSLFFYHLMKALSFPEMPEGGFDYALLSDKVTREIFTKNEPNQSWHGSILWTGYEVHFINYMRKKRTIGKSKWTFAKKLKYLIDGVLSFSYFPIRLMSVVGLIVALIGFIYAIDISIERFFGKVPFTGWAPIMVLILILSGIQMLMLGVIGEYLWRALDQVRNRSPYVIDKIYD